jgi:hypothetical protein
MYLRVLGTYLTAPGHIGLADEQIEVESFV